VITNLENIFYSVFIYFFTVKLFLLTTLTIIFATFLFKYHSLAIVSMPFTWAIFVYNIVLK